MYAAELKEGCRRESLRVFDDKTNLEVCSENTNSDQFSNSLANIEHLDRLSELTKEPVEFKNIYKVAKIVFFIKN